MLERLCLVLGTPSDPRGRVGRSDRGEGSFGFPAIAVALTTRLQISVREWMDKLKQHHHYFSIKTFFFSRAGAFKCNMGALTQSRLGKFSSVTFLIFLWEVIQGRQISMFSMQQSSIFTASLDGRTLRGQVVNCAEMYQKQLKANNHCFKCYCFSNYSLNSPNKILMQRHFELF